MFCVVSAIPSMIPTMLPLAFSVWVKKTGNIGYNISEEISANRLVSYTILCFVFLNGEMHTK